jgi:two-component system response regulator TctD
MQPDRLAGCPVRLLLIEDNRELAVWLSRILHDGKYTVDCVHDGLEADRLLHQQSYDLVILDLALPGLDGGEVLARLRRHDHETPVLVLTANNSLDQRIGEMDRGADDYMTKPFQVGELEARIRALLRRASKRRDPVLQCGRLRYDSIGGSFSAGEAPLSLPPREHALLEALVMKMGSTVSKQALASSLFSMHEDVSPEAIEVYIHRLRKKLEPAGVSIVTLRGLGYLLKQSDAL